MATTTRNARPSSRFPFAPLTNDETYERKGSATSQVALDVLFPYQDPIVRRRILAASRQELADLTRSSDVRCGYKRSAWAHLDGPNDSTDVTLEPVRVARHEVVLVPPHRTILALYGDQTVSEVWNLPADEVVSCRPTDHDRGCRPSLPLELRDLAIAAAAREAALA